MSGGSSAAPPRDAGRGRPRVPWWVLFVVLAAAVVALAWQPWASGGASVAAPTPALSSAGPLPVPVPSPSATDDAAVPSVPPSPDSTLTSTSNTVPTAPPPTFPGSATAFDEAGALELFVTADQLASTILAAADGVVPVAAPGWGLPTGSVVTPGPCLVARTIVTRAPVGFVARQWTGAGLTYEEQVALLGDPTAARAAFATLVGQVDACPQYTQSGAGGGTWTTQPAVEGQGLYPSIVQQVAFEGSGRQTEGFRGHLLVGNAIVTWTTLTAGDLEGLGAVEDLSAIVQDRALAAVRASG